MLPVSVACRRSKRFATDGCCIPGAMIRDADSSTVNVPIAIPTATESKASEHGCGGSKPTECACKTKHAHDHGHSHDDQPAAFKAAPDFKKMTTAEKVAWNKAKRDRLYG